MSKIKDSTAESQKPKYARKDLINNAKAAFGVQPEVVAGALASKKGDEFTKTEVEDALKAFKERKVK